MTGPDPPQDQRGLDRSEPFLSPSVEALMQGLPDETLQRLHIFPDRQVWQDCRVVIDAHVHGMPALILQAPDEPGDFVRQAIYSLDIVDEFRHPRIIERVTNPRDVELG